MKRLLGIGILLALAGCTQSEGERCNPLQFTSDCNSGLTCVYPTAPNCGVAFCCRVDDMGNVVDTNRNCRPDPAAAAACMLDLGGAPLDGGAGD